MQQADALGRWRWLAALAAGLVSATGFQPLNLWPLSLLALMVLMALVRSAAKTRQAFGVGWWFGLGHFVLGLNWIATAFTYQAAMPAWLGWVAVVLLSLYLAIFPAMAAGLSWRFGSGDPVRFGLVLAVAWMLTEWLRGVLFTGFAWNPLGALLLPLLPVARAASVVGALGLSACVILIATLLSAVLLHRYRIAAGFTAALLLLAIAGNVRLGGQEPPAGARVRIVQPNIGQDEKWAQASSESIFRRFAALSGQPDGTPRMLLWPESALPVYLEDEPLARARLLPLLGPKDMLLTGGVSLIRDASGNVTAARNSMFTMDSQGRIVGRYDKAHLVPYGEYLPMRPLLSLIGLSRLAPGALDFMPGPGPRTIALPNGTGVGVQICYEIIFSGHVVDEAHRPTFLFNPSNDAWFGAWGPPQHLAQARLRAIEEGVPIARSTPTGISAIIDPLGRVAARLPYRAAGVIDARLPGAVPPTPFARFHGWLELGLALALLAAATAVTPKTGRR